MGKFTINSESFKNLVPGATTGKMNGSPNTKATSANKDCHNDDDIDTDGEQTYPIDIALSFHANELVDGASDSIKDDLKLQKSSSDFGYDIFANEPSTYISANELPNEEFSRLYERCNSPFGSYCNSLAGSDHGSPSASFALVDHRSSSQHLVAASACQPLLLTDTTKPSLQQPPILPASYKKMTIEEAARRVERYYSKHTKFYGELDILITYLRGVKLMHMYAAQITQAKMYVMTISGMGCLLAGCIVAPMNNGQIWGTYIIIGCNALAMLLFIAIRHMNLNVATYMHTLIANQYEQLQSIAEHADTPEMTEYSPSHSATIMQIEEHIRKLKETYPILMPEEIIHGFPILYNTNIFRLFANITKYERQLIVSFCNIKNEIYYILHMLQHQQQQNVGNKYGGLSILTSDDTSSAAAAAIDQLERAADTSSSSEEHATSTIHRPRHVRENMRLVYLMKIKEKIKHDIMIHKHTYNQIEDLFSQEMRYIETHRSCIACIPYLRKEHNIEHLTPAVQDFLKLVIV